jgi:oligopeptidase A
MSAQNPLLDLGREIPFDAIRAEHVVPAVEIRLAEAKAEVRAISEDTGPKTYDAVLDRLERATEKLEVLMTVVGHLESVTSNPQLRAAYNQVKPDVSAFWAGIPLDEGLWRALKACAASKEQLSPVRSRFLERTMDDFRRHGADLDAKGKSRLEELTREFAQLTLKFAQNIVDSTAAYELILDDEGKLKGLPESAIEAARASAQQKNASGWRFTLQAPSVIPVLTYLDDRSIRERIYRAYNRRATEGAWDNRPLIGRILELRREKARLLGYDSFADLVLEDRMAKRGAEAKAFIADLTERTRPWFDRENQQLLAFKKQLDPDGGPIAPWDLGYYAEKQRQALYAFDEEELRPFFALERVLQGLFETAKRLYGVEVVPAPSLPTWSAAVRAFSVKDRDGTVLGAFYTDFYPREEKRSGAWMNGLVTGVLEGRRLSPHLGVICANVTPPVGDKPALLTHDEVQTLFHEFGHLLHHLLSKVEVRSLAGTNVAWDFVELPSQIMENWTWEREALDLFSEHWQTKARIPQDLFEKMVRARTYRAANAMMRQLGFATVDLSLHIDYRPDLDGDVVDYARRKMQGFAPVQLPEDYAFISSFGHLFSSEVGYAAGYYSYKWAEVLDADAFSRFKEHGVFSAEVGSAFRLNILERGNGADPMELYKQFMGREPKLEALLVRSGLVGA